MFLLLIAIVLLPFLIGILPINISFMRDNIRQVVRESFDTDVNIRGTLWVHLGPNPRFSVSDIFLGSPDVSIRRFVHLDSLQINPAFWALLKGDIHLISLAASGLSVDYCPAWLPGKAPRQQREYLPSVAVNKVRIQDIHLHCGLADKQTGFIFDTFDLEGSARQGDSIDIKISGAIDKTPFELYATAGTLDSLLGDPARFPLKLELRLLSSELSIDGRIESPFSEPSFAAIASLNIENLTRFLGVFGLDSMPLEKLKSTAHLQVNMEEIILEEAQATLDNMQLTFSGLIKKFSGRPYLEITMQLDRLDSSMLVFADRDDAATGDNWKEISFKPWFDEMKRFDADIRLNITQILNMPLSGEAFYLSAKLNKGELIVDQVDLLLEGSPVHVEASLNMNVGCPALNAELRIDTIDLSLLNPFIDDNLSISGQLEHLLINTASCGEKLSEIADNLSVVATLTDIKPDFQNMAQRVIVDSLSVEFSNQERGKLNFEGKLEGEELSIEISFAALNDILSGSSWPLTLKADGTGGNVRLNGIAAIVEGQPSMEGHLSAEIYSVGGSTSLIGVDPDYSLDMEVDTQISFDQAKLSLTGLDINLGQSNLAGSFSWSPGEQGSTMITNLHSKYIDLEELAGLLTPSGEPEITSDFDWLTDLDRVEKWFTLPSVKFDFVAEKVRGINFDLDQLMMTGKVSDGLIDNARVKFKFEEIEIEGRLHADLRQEHWTLEYESEAINVDIANLLSKFDFEIDDKIKANRLVSELTSEGQSIQELVTNVRFTSRIEDFHWSRKVSVGTKTDELFLSYLESTMAPSVTTHWSGEGDLNGVPVNLLMQTPSISETLDRNKPLPFNVVLRSGDDVIMIDAIVSQRTKANPRVEITVSGQKRETLNVPLSQLQSPLSDYEFHSHITTNNGEFHFSEMEARLGKSIARGRVDMTLVDEKNHFNIAVTSPYIETNDFIPLIQELRAINGASTPDSAETQDLESLLVLVNQKIDDLVTTHAFDARLDIEQLWSNGNLLGKAQFGLRLNGDELYIEPIDLTSTSGTVDAEYYRKRTKDGLETGLDVQIEGLEYSGIVRLLNPESDGSGLVYLDMSLFTEGSDLEELPAAWEGDINLAIFPDSIPADILDVWASNLIFALLPKLPGTGDKKKINCLVARFDSENSVLTSRKLLLDTTDILVHGRGSIDLVNQELDLLFSPQAKLERFLSVSAPIKVEGPFNNFKIGVTQGGFVMTLFRWYMGLIYVPYKRLTGEKFPADGIATCYNAMDWELPESSIQVHIE